MTFGISNLDVLKRPFILGLVGLGATALYAILAALGAWLTTASAAVVSLAAYAVSAVASYVAHRNLTFSVEGRHGDAPLRFALLSLAGYAIAFAAPLILTDWLGYPMWIPVAITCVMVPILNAVALSRLVFRKPLIDTPRGKGP